MAESTEQIVRAIEGLKQEITVLYTKKDPVPKSEPNVNELVTYMIAEREKTNKILKSLAERLVKIENDIDKTYDEPRYELLNQELPISNLDSRILGFIQSQPNSMACADDVMKFMNYKGRNAACNRLSKLYRDSLLNRVQLGHRVYYKFDAGKTTNTLIISPPQ